MNLYAACGSIGVSPCITKTVENIGNAENFISTASRVFNTASKIKRRFMHERLLQARYFGRIFSVIYIIVLMASDQSRRERILVGLKIRYIHEIPKYVQPKH